MQRLRAAFSQQPTQLCASACAGSETFQSTKLSHAHLVLPCTFLTTACHCMHLACAGKSVYIFVIMLIWCSLAHSDARECTHLHDRVRSGAFRVSPSAACAAVGVAVLHQLLDNVLVIHLDFLHAQRPYVCMVVVRMGANDG